MGRAGDSAAARAGPASASGGGHLQRLGARGAPGHGVRETARAAARDDLPMQRRLGEPPTDAPIGLLQVRRPAQEGQAILQEVDPGLPGRFAGQNRTSESRKFSRILLAASGNH
ncbi:hypothetical protein ABXN37_15495 [Piscinibacter sakaiensis]